MDAKIAVFPGSFDPVTLGHIDIIQRATVFFDKLIIAVGININKKYMFPLEQRIDWLNNVLKNKPNISVTNYSGLTVDFCKKVNAKYIIRGLRTAADFEFERIIGQVNKKLYPEIETIYLLSSNKYASLNSSVVRDIFINGGDISPFVPKEVILRM